MRHARLAALTVVAVLMIAACSGSSSSTPPAAASVAASTPSVAPSLAPSVAPSTAVSIAPSVAPSAAATDATGDAVSIANFSFQPAAITVPVGATVTWTNNDSAGHTVTADDGSFKSDRLGSGATFSQSFAQAGTFAYHCAIHPGMTGTVTVR